MSISVALQLIGSQDPYFILGLSGDEVKTRVVKSGGTDPVWEPEEVCMPACVRCQHTCLNVPDRNYRTAKYPLASP